MTQRQSAVLQQTGQNKEYHDATQKRALRRERNSVATLKDRASRSERQSVAMQRTENRDAILRALRREKRERCNAMPSARESTAP